MPWVRFLVPFDHHVGPTVTIAHKPGVRLVTTDCARQAIAAGKAERCRKPAPSVPEENADGSRPPE